MVREQEVVHLAEADRHIEEAHVNIARLEEAIAASIASGRDASPAQATLATMREVLATFLAQREHIVQTLADIDAGKYVRNA